MKGLTKKAAGFEPGGRDAFRATVTRALAESTVRDRNLQGDAEGYALRAGTSFNEGTPSEECILSRSFLRCAILCYTLNDDNRPQFAAPSSRRFSRLLTAPIAN